jgi:spermidine synthase
MKVLSEGLSSLDPRQDSSDRSIQKTLARNIRILQRVGVWPGHATVGDPSTGKPFVSEAGDCRSLHFSWACVQSGMSIAEPLKLTLDYTKSMMGFLFFESAPRRIEMIGLGGGSLAKYCRHILPDADVTVIEIDPNVIALRDSFLVPPEGPSFRVLCDDGARYVRQSSARPDVILIDGFDASGQPPELCSAEFYHHCRKRLAAGGLMIANLWGDDPLCRLYEARIEQCFAGNTVTVPSMGSFNRVVIARKDMKLSLSRLEVDRIAGRFSNSNSGFLRTIGRRVERQLKSRGPLWS